MKVWQSKIELEPMVCVIPMPSDNGPLIHNHTPKLVLMCRKSVGTQSHHFLVHLAEHRGMLLIQLGRPFSKSSNRRRFGGILFHYPSHSVLPTLCLGTFSLRV